MEMRSPMKRPGKNTACARWDAAAKNVEASGELHNRFLPSHRLSEYTLGGPGTFHESFLILGKGHNLPGSRSEEMGGQTMLPSFKSQGEIWFMKNRFAVAALLAGLALSSVAFADDKMSDSKMNDKMSTTATTKTKKSKKKTSTTSTDKMNASGDKMSH
jgi:hypothetical protein